MTGGDLLPGPVLDHYAWQLDGACRGMDSDVFFHSAGEGARTRRRRERIAVEICRGCPVMAACRAHALSVREPYGVWGGLSEIERAELLGLQSLRYPAPAGSARRRRPGRRPAGDGGLVTTPAPVGAGR